MNQSVLTLETDVSIRPAVKSDVPRIVDLIGYLAKTHDRQDQMIATEEQLLRDGFGDHPQFEAVVAEANGEVVGIAIFHPTYHLWTASRGLFIEELAVSPRMRGHGIGQKLVSGVANIAIERNCSHLEMNVVHANPAKNFYDRFGFVHVDDLLTYRLSGQKFKRLASFAKEAMAK